MGNSLKKATSALTFNQATLSGALDVIVVVHEDGTMKCSPFHVRFGKLQLLRCADKRVEVDVNGKPALVTMKLTSTGRAYFSDDGVKEERETTILHTERQAKDYSWHWDMKSKSEVVSVQGESEVCIEDSQPRVEFSLCKDLLNGSEDLQAVFKRHYIAYEVFSADPWSLLGNPQLVVKVDDKLYDWAIGLPIIMSQVAYKIPLGIASMQHPILFNIPRRSRYELTHRELNSLKLRPGPNSIRFTVRSSLQGSQVLEASIFVWSFQSKIIVSDVDGTITRSDFLGHVMPMFGHDWAQQGITTFYQALHRQGYKILYLTSRPIGQVKKTRRYLSRLVQDGQGLPLGPIITSPDRMYKSFVREVILKKSQVFKANALREIVDLFPPLSEPLHSGFGNREKDAVAYRAAGIPMSCIYIINSKGQIVVVDKKAYLTSYRELTTLVDEFFPVTSRF
mmetsp:Transcript_10067/g.19832  ORF Transcript_10067/g.19832 Transcript_10067/m.19832 type:complete len:451 (-) Transcript_10067:4-1356(-)